MKNEKTLLREIKRKQNQWLNTDDKLRKLKTQIDILWQIYNKR